MRYYHIQPCSCHLNEIVTIPVITNRGKQEMVLALCTGLVNGACNPKQDFPIFPYLPFFSFPVGSTLSLPPSLPLSTTTLSHYHQCVAAIAAGRAHYGGGTGPILLDNVDCEGTEETLLDCVHNGANVHNCGHYEDAGVLCQREYAPVIIYDNWGECE